jgi:hypothetical protein
MNIEEEFRAAMRFGFLQIRVAVLGALSRPLGAVFWRVEQSRARAQTALNNERASRERR